MLYNKYNFNKSGFRIGIGSKQQVIMRVLDTIRLHLVNKINRDWVSVLQAISSNGVVLPPAVIIKGARIIY